jgi:hypothetical protein
LKIKTVNFKRIESRPALKKFPLIEVGIVFWGTFSFFEASLASATRFGTFERKSQHLKHVANAKNIRQAQAGFEPTTFWSEDQCSTTELLRILMKFFNFFFEILIRTDSGAVLQSYQ